MRNEADRLRMEGQRPSAVRPTPDLLEEGCISAVTSRTGVEVFEDGEHDAGDLEGDHGVEARKVGVRGVLLSADCDRLGRGGVGDRAVRPTLGDGHR